jgi:uncharacterized protein YkuJ
MSYYYKSKLGQFLGIVSITVEVNSRSFEKLGYKVLNVSYSNILEMDKKHFTKNFVVLRK